MDLLAQMATFVSVVDGKSLSAAARAQRIQPQSCSSSSGGTNNQL